MSYVQRLCGMSAEVVARNSFKANATAFVFLLNDKNARKSTAESMMYNNLLFALTYSK